LTACWDEVNHEARKSSKFLQLFLLAVDQTAEFLHGPYVQLSDALLGYPQLFADLFQGHAFGVAVEARTHPDYLPLAGVEVLQEPIDLVGRLLGRREAFLFIRAVVRGRIEQFLRARHITLAAVSLFGDAAREVLHDRPASIRAELVATAVIEFLHGSNQ